MDTSSNPPIGLDLFLVRLQRSGRLVDKYYTPFLCLFGALGNILSLIVFCHADKFKGKSSSYYLAALALSDTGYLVNLLVFCLEDALKVGIITNPIMCPLVMYLGQVTCFMSVYIMVAFSVERFVAVEYPYSRLKYCTPEVSRKVTRFIVAVALILFSYACVIAQVIEKNPPITDSLNVNFRLNISSENFTDSAIYDLNNDSSPVTVKQPKIIVCRCSVPKQYYKVSEIANYVDTVITLLIPVVLIACLNIRIYYFVGKIMQERKSIVANEERATPLLKEEHDLSNSSMLQPRLVVNKRRDTRRGKTEQSLESDGVPGESKARLSRKSETCQNLAEQDSRKKDESNWDRKVTKTLLVVSTVFLCLNLPLHTVRCGQFITYMRGITSGKKLLRALEPWGNLLFNTNFAINFILYYISGRNFRETLKQFLPFARVGRKQQPCVTVSQYRHSYQNYTVELSTFNLRSAVERKSIHRDGKNTTSGLMNLRDECVIQNCSSKLTVKIYKSTEEFGDPVDI